jgi:hypothetical protein
MTDFVLGPRRAGICGVSHSECFERKYNVHALEVIRHDCSRLFAASLRHERFARFPAYMRARGMIAVEILMAS